MNFSNPNIAFPIDKVYLDNTFSGYTMNMLDGSNLIRKLNKICIGLGDMSLKEVIDVKNNSIELIEYLTNNNILMVDYNLSNVLINDNDVKFIDLDFYKKYESNDLYTKNIEAFNNGFKDLFLIMFNKNNNLLMEDVYLYNMLYSNMKNNINYEKYVDEVVVLIKKDNVKSLGEIINYRK